MEELIRALRDVRAQWRNLGLELGISVGTIKVHVLYSLVDVANFFVIRNYILKVLIILISKLTNELYYVLKVLPLERRTITLVRHVERLEACR